MCLKLATLDGKRIAYCDSTQFLIQARSPQGRYKTKYEVIGNFGQAILLYNGLNIGHGYTKRLLMPADIQNPIIAKVKS